MGGGNEADFEKAVEAKPKKAVWKPQGMRLRWLPETEWPYDVKQITSNSSCALKQIIGVLLSVN